MVIYNTSPWFVVLLLLQLPHRLLWFCSLTHPGFVLLLSFKLDGSSAAGSRLANAFPQGNKNKLWYFSPITDFSCSGIWCVNGSPCSASKPLQRLKHVYLHKHVPLFVSEPGYLCAASALVAREAGEQCSAFEISSARNEIIVSKCKLQYREYSETYTHRIPGVPTASHLGHFDGLLIPRFVCPPQMSH